MSDWEKVWRPAAMSALENDSNLPSSFSEFTFAGIGLTCGILEPKKLEKTTDWLEIIADLESWGEVPDPDKIGSLSVSENERGPVVEIASEKIWIAEFLPWGTDGFFRKRSESAGDSAIAPCGIYYWKDREVILLRQKVDYNFEAGSELAISLSSGEMGRSKEILHECGAILGRYHDTVRDVRTTPPDPRKWNFRLSKIEERLRADSLWRAPHQSTTECMLSLGDVRFSDIVDGKIRIGRPRIADGLIAPECEFPAIRDLSSLVHDLSRICYEVGNDLDMVDLRSSLIAGWKSTAPETWCSEKSFYSHRGGLAIWEYEQCLMDVIEAVANQSGAPEPAVTLIKFVRPYQKKMFNNRTIGALSFMSFFFGLSTLIGSLPLSIPDLPIPVACFVMGVMLNRYYRRLSPAPELPFNHFWG
ncbi:MAG TPA: hypothetical protein QF703_00785 [Candidatus Thalassarchaeaceae archaeon]|nr:hypothetical protein [Candidatus Thalassarchaeaceae archaeon]|tara:strand:+ start:2032 stop:3282 length:1251 start_codon:yes stop_codon:yes gene_type:complete